MKPLTADFFKYFLLQGMFIMILFGIGCSLQNDKIPDQIIPPKKMIQILADIHLAQAQGQLQSTADDINAVKRSYYQSVLQYHEISYKEFAASVQYYISRPDMLKEMYEKVLSELSRRQAEAEGKKASELKIIN